VGATAAIDEATNELRIAIDGSPDQTDDTIDLPGDPAIITVAAVDGRFWVGTDRGLVILTRPADGRISIAEHIAIPGGVKSILPLFGDRGVVIITLDGAVGHLGG
jgi:ligand-binding sensor domain-containing protein